MASCNLCEILRFDPIVAKTNRKPIWINISTLCPINDFDRYIAGDAQKGEHPKSNNIQKKKEKSDLSNEWRW